MGSKTFGVYLAKWRHPSWKWPVRRSVAAGKCKLSNIYMRRSTRMICMARQRGAPLSRPFLLLSALECKVEANQIGYILSLYSSLLYMAISSRLRNSREWKRAILYHEIFIRIIRRKPRQHLHFYREFSFYSEFSFCSSGLIRILNFPIIILFNLN